MSKDRITPCKSYVCEGSCEKGREGTHNNYCQRCNLYDPRAHIKHQNRKKTELEKIRKKEWD